MTLTTVQSPEGMAANQAAESDRPMKIDHPVLTQPMLMANARKTFTFDPNAMAVIIMGSKQAVNQHKAAFYRVEKALGLDDMSKLPAIYGKTDRHAMLLDGLHTGKVTFSDSLDQNHEIFHYHSHKWVLANSNPFGISTFLFIPMLKLQAGPEQLEAWLPHFQSGRMIGSYTQTELGHGTFVAGIQTTATFDKERDQFVINSPTLSSTKFWPGALGLTCSHTMVMARLIIGVQDFGVHAFMVQLRSLNDWKPLPGIELGDIGLKMSYNGTDNGYAVFNNVCIPRANLLMRFATVSRDGTYNAAPLREKLLYGGMLNGRFIIAKNAAFQLAQALTIASRYSTVREQGQKNMMMNGQSEAQIIAYKIQHYRLLTLISKVYANLFASKSAEVAQAAMLKQQAAGDHSSLPYIHMLVSGLKAWCTQNAVEGAEDCRKMCGGHGYMMISGLPDIVTAITATCTFEGENQVMWKQVSNYLIKGMAARSLLEDMQYMSNFPVNQGKKCRIRGPVFLRHEILLEIFQHRAARLTNEAYKLLLATEATGKSRPEAENIHAVLLQCAARAHIELYILHSFSTQIRLLPKTTPTAIITVLSRLSCLFGLLLISSPLSLSSSSFIEDSYLSLAQINDMRKETDKLMEELLPDVLALMDSWSFTDASLGSALGCWDGDVYKRVMSWCRQLPINVEARRNGGVFKEGWEGYLKPFFEERRVRGDGVVLAKF